MDVSFDADTPREFDGSPNACMNPWLEARFDLGMSSNCLTCHRRSTWPQEPFLPVTRGTLDPGDAFFNGKTAPEASALVSWRSSQPIVHVNRRLEEQASGPPPRVSFFPAVINSRRFRMSLDQRLPLNKVHRVPRFNTDLSLEGVSIELTEANSVTVITKTR
ncbi:MAG: hypothetical protein U0936_18570 [Planctomycetaceae bacterium]